MTTPALGPLTKVSANFTQRSVIALEAASEISGDNQTDCLNRAIQLYAYITKVHADGERVVIVNPATGTREVLELL